MRNWKVGSLTAGCLLILTGLLLLVHLFFPLPISGILFYTWPVICIALGGEILFLHFMKKEASLRFSFVSIFLLIVVTLTSLGYFVISSTMHDLGFSFKTYKQEVNDTLTMTEEVNEVIVNIPNASIQVEGTDTNETTVQGVMYINGNTKEQSTENFAENYTFKQLGNKLYISLKKQLNKFRFDDDEQHIVTISVPKKIALQIDTQFSDVTVQNHESPMRVTMDTGSFQAKNINGPLQAKLSSGNATLTNVSLTDTSRIEATNITVAFNNKQTSKVEGLLKEHGKLAGNIGWQKTEANQPEKRITGTAMIGNGEHNVQLEVEHGTISVSK
jgi:hypothetical protein